MEEPRLLRPMSYGEIFNEAFDLYKRNFTLFAGIGAVVYVPWALLTAFTAGQPVLSAILGLALYLPLFAATGAMTKALADRVLGHEATIASSWANVLRCLVPFVLTSILAWLMLVGGMMLFLVPGIIVAFWLFFLWSVMIVEQRFYRDAIRRCRELAAGQYLRILVMGIVILVISGIGLLLMSILVALPLAFVGAVGGQGAIAMGVKLFQALVYAGIEIFLTPFTSLMSVLFYFDVRVRKEGFDVELLARELGESAFA